MKVKISVKISFGLPILILGFLYSPILTPTVVAHPGNTSSDGMHYCWTRCDYWGEVYGERHGHYSAPTYEEEYVPYEDYSEEDYNGDQADYYESLADDAEVEAASDPQPYSSSPTADSNVNETDSTDKDEGWSGWDWAWAIGGISFVGIWIGAAIKDNL